jgi:hypothetical protein
MEQYLYQHGVAWSEPARGEPGRCHDSPGDLEAVQGSRCAVYPSAQAEVNSILPTDGMPGVRGLIAQAETWTPQPGGGVSASQMALLQAIQNAPGVSSMQSDSSGAVPTALTPNMTTAAISNVARHRSVTAHAADACWYQGDHVYGSWRWYLPGQKVADVAVNHGYWCGNGSKITQNGLNYYWNQWAQFPWCVDASQQYQGWDGPNFSWSHGHVHGDTGDTYGVGCLHDGASGSAALRINGAGGHDTYNDWGF